MTTRIQLRRDTAARWASVNPVLAAGEPAVEADTGKLKVGDGSTAWSSLPYILDVADLTPVIEALVAGAVPPGMSDEQVRDIVGTTVIGDGDYLVVDADDIDNVVRVLPGAAITEGLSDLQAGLDAATTALGTKVNSSTYVAGLATKQDALSGLAASATAVAPTAAAIQSYDTRRVDTATVTSGSGTVADTSIGAGDVGLPVTGTGIPSGALVGTVSAGVSFTLKNSIGTAQTATANGTSVTIHRPLTVTLPALSALAVGTQYGVQKAVADTTGNRVTLACAGADQFDSGATSLVLSIVGELRILQVVSIGGVKRWKVVGGNNPTSSNDARYPRRSAPKVAIVGCSHLEQGAGPGSVTGNPATNAKSIFTYANSWMRHAFKQVGNLAVGGTNSLQILGTIPQALALDPDFVLYISGASNDTGVGFSAATSIGYIDAAITMITDAGKVAVVLTNPPSYDGNTTYRNWQEPVNAWIRQQGRSRRNVLVVDIAARVTNPATGGYIAAYAAGSGNVHMSARGLGQAALEFAKVMAPYATTDSFLPLAENDPVNLIQRSHFQVSTGGVPTNGPSGWSLSNPTAGTTYDLVDRTDGKPGKWFKVVVPAGGSITIFSPDATVGANLAVGDLIFGTLEYACSGLTTETTNQALGINLIAKPSFSQIATDLSFDSSPAPTFDRSGTFETPLVAVPAATTAMTLKIDVYGGGTYLFSSAGIFNTTKNSYLAP